MRERVKDTERICFSKSEKEEMLRKSNGKCAHCGNPISIGVDFTVEHATPLGKGSNNDPRNLVALCEDCNKAKADKIILKDVGNYYKYLNIEALLSLMEYTEEYGENVEWFNYNNWLKDDECILTPKGIPNSEHWIEDKNNLRVIPKVVLKKATYEDLDNIFEYFVKRGCDREVIRPNIIEEFTLGSIYVLYNSSKELVGTFAIALRKTSVGQYSVPIIYSISATKKYHLALEQALNLVVNTIKNKTATLIVTICFEVVKTEEVAINAVNSINKGMIVQDVDEESTLFIGNFAKSSTLVGKATKSSQLIENLKKQSKGYTRLLENRRKDCRRFLSYDLYEVYKEVIE